MDGCSKNVFWWKSPEVGIILMDQIWVAKLRQSGFQLSKSEILHLHENNRENLAWLQQICYPRLHCYYSVDFDAARNEKKGGLNAEKGEILAS